MKLFLLLLVAGCAMAPPLPPAPGLREVIDPPVGCKVVGRFEGTSSQAAEAGMAQAREQARAKAAAAGATHVTTGREWQTPDATAAAVEAYDCK